MLMKFHSLEGPRNQITYFLSQPGPVSLGGGTENLGKRLSGEIRMKLGGMNKHKSR